MDFVYFCTTLMAAWFAYNLYWPNYKSERGMVPSFFAGWIIGEAIPHIIIAQAIATMLFAMVGAIHGIWGKLGILITIGAWIAMLGHYATSLRAKHVVEGALKAALGRNYQQAISPLVQTDLNKGIDLESIAKPWRWDRADVKRVKNIKYDSKDGFNLKLDIYHHHSLPQNCPILFQIHGGAWTYQRGSKNEQARPLMNHLAAHGWVCVSVDYRLSPKATFPEHIVDCKKAFAWVKEHIHQYGGNPDFVLVTGGSAGGHLSALFALSANDPKFQPGFENVDTTVQGCIPFYGVYDFTNTHDLHANAMLSKLLHRSIMKSSIQDNRERYVDASPLHRIHEDAPPFFIIHGDSDTLAPKEEARMFVEELRKTSNQVVAYAEIEGAQHAFDIFPSIRSEYCKLGIEHFSNYLYSQHLAKQKVSNPVTDKLVTLAVRNE